MRAEQLAGLGLAFLGVLVLGSFVMAGEEGPTALVTAGAGGALPLASADATTHALFFVLGLVLLGGGASVFLAHRAGTGGGDAEA